MHDSLPNRQSSHESGSAIVGCNVGARPDHMGIESEACLDPISAIVKRQHAQHVILTSLTLRADGCGGSARAGSVQNKRIIVYRILQSQFDLSVKCRQHCVYGGLEITGLSSLKMDRHSPLDPKPDFFQVH